ncbi:MAG TPA: universal stress protein [Candidatus Binatia bacterium]|nr:universal stress protein [Candidatus Binatia bacterium]
MEKVKILAPTDFSEISVGGVRYALEMAVSLGAEVILYHVIVGGDNLFSTYEDLNPARPLLQIETCRLDKFVKEKLADYCSLVEIRQVVEIGAPHVNIVEKAEREAVDMIVMSTHGRTGIDHFLLGSVTEKVVARASCPVLTIPPIERRTSKAKQAESSGRVLVQPERRH